MIVLAGNSPGGLVTFDKLTGLVSGKGLQLKFNTMKEAFAYASELNNTEGVENIQIQRIDTSR